MNKRSPTVRFGVISDRAEFYVWQEMILNKLIAQQEFQCCLLLLPQRTGLSEPGSSPGVVHQARFLGRMYSNMGIKQRVMALQKERGALFADDLVLIEVDFTMDGTNRRHMDEEALSRLDEAQLDFLLDFSANPYTGRGVDVPKAGIWRFLVGDPEKYRGGIPGFWEIYHEDPVIRLCLVRLTPSSDRMILLKEGYLKTQMSFAKTTHVVAAKLSSWALQCYRNNRNGPEDQYPLLSGIDLTNETGSPTHKELFIFFFRRLKQRFKKAKKSLFYTDYWNIGVTDTPIADFLDPGVQPHVQWFPNPPKSRFMADPFGISYDDKLYLIYEDFRYDQGIGKIACRRFQDNTFGEMEIVMDEKFHLSYPYLIEHEGEIYCIPESYQKNQVCLYKAEDFPRQWALSKVLIDGYAGLDNTVLQYEGTWFLFSTDKHSGPHHDLNLHYAENLFGPWNPHPKNPVKTDVRSARPAGALFFHKGELFRPAMDYSERVEGRITLNRITKLSREEFAETRHALINPFDNTYFTDKVHTLNQMGPYTLIDGAKELFVFNNLKVLQYKLRTLRRKLNVF